MAEQAPRLLDPEPQRLLLVDDDRDFADSLANLLRLEGYEVAVAYGFEEAVERLATAGAAVALVDIRLGLNDGVELVGELHRRDPELVAVMVTAYASVDTTIRALQAGAYDYVRKPFHTGEILATLDRSFEHRRLRQERAQALAVVQARNLELEALNARLAEVLSSAQALAGAPSAKAAGRILLEAVVRGLGLERGAFYRPQERTLCREEATGPGFEPGISWLPPEGSVLARALAERRPTVAERAGGGAVLALVLVDAQDTVHGALLAMPRPTGALPARTSRSRRSWHPLPSR